MKEQLQVREGFAMAVAVILFICSAIFIMTALHFGLALIKPGVYPPKQVLKVRALTLGCAGGILLLIGGVIIYFM
jgi:hypothetical protein